MNVRIDWVSLMRPHYEYTQRYLKSRIKGGRVGSPLKRGNLHRHSTLGYFEQCPHRLKLQTKKMYTYWV